MPDTANIILIAEGTSDPRVAQGFAVRAIQELDSFADWSWVQWRGLEQNTDFLPWQRVKTLAQEKRIMARGRFRDADLQVIDAEEKAVEVRKALHLCDHFFEDLGQPLAVILFFDSDGRKYRFTGADQARVAHKAEYPIVVGMAHPCREAWLVCSFSAHTKPEEILLETLKQELSFHPCRQPENLNTTAGHDRNAKIVLERLIGKSIEREKHLIATVLMSQLQTHGKNCGLLEYLEEVQKHLAPLLGVSHDRG